MQLREVYTYFIAKHNEASDMIVCAFIIGVADIWVTLADFCWLIGDYLHAPAPHHFYIGIGLLTGVGIMALSFVWLYYAIRRRAIKHKNKIKRIYTKKINIEKSLGYSQVMIECEYKINRIIIDEATTE